MTHVRLIVLTDNPRSLGFSLGEILGFCLDVTEHTCMCLCEEPGLKRQDKNSKTALLQVMFQNHKNIKKRKAGARNAKDLKTREDVTPENTAQRTPSSDRRQRETATVNTRQVMKEG